MKRASESSSRGPGREESPPPAAGAEVAGPEDVVALVLARVRARGQVIAVDPAALRRIHRGGAWTREIRS